MLDRNPVSFEIETDVKGCYWTLRQMVRQSIKHVCHTASGGSYFAVLTLVLEPDSEMSSVTFQNNAPAEQIFAGLGGYSAENERFVQQCINHIIEGINLVLMEKATEKTPVSGISIQLTELLMHAIDSKPSAYKKAAVMVTGSLLQQQNLINGV